MVSRTNDKQKFLKISTDTGTDNKGETKSDDREVAKK